jgi:hypothetical protein
MNALFTRITPIVACATMALAGTAVAQSTVDMTGWQTFGATGAPGNSATTVAVPSGVTGVSSLAFDINFDALGGSWKSEFVIRVEVPGSTVNFLSIKPAVGQNTAGNFTGSGTSATTTFAGAPFSIPAGTTSLNVFVYESYNDGGDATQDAQVNSGTLTINFGNPPPPFDPCASPVAGVIGTNTVPMSSTSPNLDVNCPTFNADANKASYIQFTSAEGGTFVARSCAQATDTVMAVVTTCGDALTALTCNDDTANGACPPLSSEVEFTLAAGQTVYIAVGLYSTTAAPPATLLVDIAAGAPPFDACSAPTPAVVGLNVLATNEGAFDLDMGTFCDMGTFGDEINRHPTYLAFTAPASEYYVVDTCSQTDDARISILTTCGDASTVVACDDDGCGGQSDQNYASSVGFNAVAGTTYYIAVGAYSEPGFEATLAPELFVNIAVGTPPANPCDAPTEAVLGLNTLATDVMVADLDLTGICDSGPLGDEFIRHPTYLRFVPATSGWYRVNSCAQTDDTRIAVMSTCGDASTVSACDDDACGTPTDTNYASSVAFEGVAGTPVFIAVGAYSEPGFTAPLAPQLVIEIGPDVPPPPPLNPCDPANILTGIVGVNQVIPNAEYPNLDLTGFCTFPIGTPVLVDARFISFVPTVSGLYTIGNCGDTGTTVDARLAVLTTCGDPSSNLACDDDGCTAGAAPYTSKIEIELTAGSTYYIAVGGFNAAAVGPFNVEITAPAAPPCTGDLNSDGNVTGADLGLLLGNWGFSGTGDLNGDGVVTGADLGLLLGQWGACP